MATFKKGDWVQVTPTRDWRWEHWTKDHDEMVGGYGVIEMVQSDGLDPNLIYVYVSISDKDGKPINQAWFLEKHVIKSSKYDAKMSDEFKKACDELQVWEKKRRQMLDDSLKKAFGLESEKKKEKKTKSRPKRKRINLASSTEKSQAQIYEDEYEELANEWEEATEEISIDDICSEANMEELLDNLYFDGTD